ncbi:DNA-binding GntR family transcriptional regulator [Skermanella aerolata]|uniref:GntR family transcriptional regulator n=1 Tax=Skermanella aerolata TaxID=393310 RepID=UPI003D199C95
MRALTPQPRLVEQVYHAILTEITEGTLPPNSRLIQDELAEAYGVSRQPVQQALLLLRSHGLVNDAPRRGLVVAALDEEHARNLYKIRSVLEGLACRMAAENGAARARIDGPAIIARGREAIESGSVAQQIEMDTRFHCFLYELSGNPLIAETTKPHWDYLRRVMGEVLREGDSVPGALWDEHAGILDAVCMGDGDAAEMLARKHICGASDIFVARLKAQREGRIAASTKSMTDCA